MRDIFAYINLDGYVVARNLSCVFWEVNTSTGTNLDEVIPAIVREISAYHQDRFLASCPGTILFIMLLCS